MRTVASGHFGTQSDMDIREDNVSMARLSGVSSWHFLRLIEERGDVGFWTSEFATNRLTVSDGLKRLMAIQDTSDISYDDLIGMMHPDDKALNENVHDLLRSGQPVNREFRVIRADGTLRWIRNIAEVVVGRNGVPIRANGFCKDVTDRYEASRSVTEGWRSYRTLISAIAAFQWRNLPDGQVVSREGYEEFVGEHLDSVTEWVERIHPDDREAANASWVESLATGDVLSSTFRLRCIDGEYRRFISRAAPILDDMAAIREWLGVLIPVGELSQADPDRLEDHRSDTKKDVMLKASVVRAARALLQWTNEELAVRAGVSISTVRRMESDENGSVRLRHFQSVRHAFEVAGVEFVDGPGSKISIIFHKSDTKAGRDGFDVTATS